MHVKYLVYLMIIFLTCNRYVEDIVLKILCKCELLGYPYRKEYTQNGG